MSLIEWMEQYGYGARATLAKKLDIQPVTIDRWLRRHNLKIEVVVGTELSDVQLVKLTKIRHLDIVQ